MALNEYILEEVQKLIDTDEYEAWKKNYLDSEYEKLKDRNVTILLRFTLPLIFVQKEGATSRSPGHGSLIHSALIL